MKILKSLGIVVPLLSAAMILSIIFMWMYTNHGNTFMHETTHETIFKLFGVTSFIETNWADASGHTTPALNELNKLTDAERRQLYALQAIVELNSYQIQSITDMVFLILLFMAGWMMYIVYKLN